MINFKGNIIDCHGHLGNYKNDNINCTPSLVMETIEKPFKITINGKETTDEVKFAFVSNLDGLEKEGDKLRKNEIDCNKDILMSCRNNPKLKALAVCQTGHGDPKNIENLLKEHNDEFYGLKFHPNDMKLIATDPIYDNYMDLARKYKKPCVFHTGSDGYSNPEHIIKLAEKHPDIPIVLYHIDINKNSQGKSQALDKMAKSINKNNTNLFVDLSWSDEKVAIEAIDKLGEKRVLFGTDIPLGRMGENKRPNYIQKIQKLKNTIHSNKEKFKEPEKTIENIFYENSKELFIDNKFFKKTKEAVEKTTKTAKKSAKKAWALLGVGIALIGLALVTYHQSHKIKRRKNIFHQ